jgi:hypothetical protein
MRLIDPNKLLVHECKQLALDYTATRMKELCGWKVLPGPKKLAWFFQTQVPDSRGNMVAPDRSGVYSVVTRRRAPGPWEF